MLTSSYLAPLIGSWIGGLLLIIIAWSWKPVDLIVLGIWILLGFPVYLGIRKLYK